MFKLIIGVECNMLILIKLVNLKFIVYVGGII